MCFFVSKKQNQEVWTPKNTNFIGLDMEKGLNRETLEWGYLRNLKTEILKENQKARTCENKGYNVIYNPVGRNFTCWDNNKNKLARLDSSGYLYWVSRSLRTTPEEDLKLKYNLQDYTDITTEKGKAYNKCRKVFSYNRCQTIKFDKVVNDTMIREKRIEFIIDLKGNNIKGYSKFSVFGDNENRYNSLWKKDSIEYLITAKKTNQIIKNCKISLEESWIKKLFKENNPNGISHACSESDTRDGGSNLVLNPVDGKNQWVILKTWASLDEYSYGIEFNWNGKLISPDPKNKENQAYTGKGWKKIKVHGILYKYKVLNDKFNNQVNIAFDYTADTADGINGIWKVGEGATKIINANNTSDLENGISIFTEGKEKLDRNGGKIIEVIEGISNASDVATAGSLLVCVETAGGGCVAAGGSWAIKKGTLYFGGKKAKRIVRKYFGEKGFRSIKKKIERKILGLLRSGKIKWQDVNRFFQNARGGLRNLTKQELSFAGIPVTEANIVAKETGVFKSVFGKAGARGLVKVNNIEEFFSSFGFGKILKNNSIRTKFQYQGTKIYKISNKNINTKTKLIKEGEYFYLDKTHKDHLEVFDRNGNFKTVLNLDGTLNVSKTERAINEKRTISNIIN